MAIFRLNTSVYMKHPRWCNLVSVRIPVLLQRPDDGTHTPGRNYLPDNKHSQNSDLCVTENCIVHSSNTTATTGW